MVRQVRHHSRRLGLVAAVALALGAGCTSESNSSVPGGDELPPAPGPALPAAPPDELGPYAVGVTTVETDVADELGRLLPVEIWYPARPSAGAPTASYELVVGVLTLATVPSPLGAVRDAPTDLRGAPHPVVIFSHGFGGIRFQSVYLTEVLATHGFVVAAPDHVGNTIAEVVVSENAIGDLEMAQLRPADLGRALDLVLALSSRPDGLLGQMADPERVGVAGHSFGGFTALRAAGASVDAAAAAAACAEEPDQRFCEGWGEHPLPPSQRDPRFVAALPQAPGGSVAFQGGGLGEVAVPTMIQAGTLDDMTPFQAEAVEPFAALPGPAYLLGIDRAGHFTFSDMCRLVDIIGLSVEEFDDGCGPDNVPATVAQPLICQYAVAFLQVTVARESVFAPWLDTRGRNLPGVARFEAK